MDGRWELLEGASTDVSGDGDISRRVHGACNMLERTCDFFYLTRVDVDAWDREKAGPERRGKEGSEEKRLTSALRQASALHGKKAPVQATSKRQTDAGHV